MRRGPRCIICKKLIRPTNEHADHLYNKPNGEEVWVCSKRCADKYNEQE